MIDLLSKRKKRKMTSILWEGLKRKIVNKILNKEKKRKISVSNNSLLMLQHWKVLPHLISFQESMAWVKQWLQLHSHPNIIITSLGQLKLQHPSILRRHRKLQEEDTILLRILKVLFKQFHNLAEVDPKRITSQNNLFRILYSYKQIV